MTTQQLYVLENDEGTMGNSHYLFLFTSREKAEAYRDAYPEGKWELREAGPVVEVKEWP